MKFEPVAFSVQGGMDFPLPPMLRVRQHFDRTCVERPEEAALRALNQLALPDLRGKRIGITAGSRRIANLPAVLRAVGAFLRARGASPFLIPAMGSHGGATAGGQAELLRSLGITEETTGMSVVSSMETRQIGTLPNGFPVWCSKTALESDGVIVCARVKPHTSIRGEVESGLCKMMTVGLGKHTGAAAFHRQGYHRLAEILPLAGQVFLDSGKILCGLALVENAFDETALIQAVPAAGLVAAEAELLRFAREQMSRFFLDEIDVLIIDRFGKDISGAGMDPNITGRAITPLPMTAPVPIRTIVALELTQASHGNATGIGGADITTRRVAESIDFGPTYTNVLTSGALTAARLPVVLNCDEEAVRAAIRCAPRETPDQVKVVHIRDTLHLSEFSVSENYASLVKDHPRLELLGPDCLRFDSGGRLLQIPG